MERSRFIVVLALPLLLLASGSGSGEYFNEDLGLSFTPPEGWEKGAGRGATLVKFREKGDLPRPAELALMHFEHSPPVSFESYLKQLKEFNAKNYSGSRLIEEKSLEVASCKAHQIAMSIPLKDGKDLFMLQTVVRRSPVTFLSIDLSSLAERKSELLKTNEALLRSLTFIKDSLSEEEKAPYRRFVDIAGKQGDVAKDLCREDRYGLHVAGKKVGLSTLSIAEAIVEGRKGYVIKTRLEIEQSSSDKIAVSTECRTTCDFRHQELLWEHRASRNGVESVSKMKGTISRGAARIEREIEGVKEETNLPLGEELVLFTDAAELARRTILGAEGKEYVFKVLHLGEDEPGVEYLEISRNEKLVSGDKDFQGHIVLVKRHRAQQKVMLYDLQRNLIEDRTVKSPIVIRRE